MEKINNKQLEGDLCDKCIFYHTKKFSSWKCGCECHSTIKQNKNDLEWSETEEITKKEIIIPI